MAPDMAPAPRVAGPGSTGHGTGLGGAGGGHTGAASRRSGSREFPDAELASRDHFRPHPIPFRSADVTGGSFSSRLSALYDSPARHALLRRHLSLAELR